MRPELVTLVLVSPGCSWGVWFGSQTGWCCVSVSCGGEGGALGKLLVPFSTWALDLREMVREGATWHGSSLQTDHQMQINERT